MASTAHATDAAASSAAITENPDRGLFRCGSCGQTYTRVDHLVRHVRSHTQEKPYRCTTCDKQFSRVDLLRRHSQQHLTSDQTPNKRRRTASTSAGSFRVSRACEECAEQHLKCDDEKPCRRCIKRNITCVSGLESDSTQGSHIDCSTMQPTLHQQKASAETTRESVHPAVGSDELSQPLPNLNQVPAASMPGTRGIFSQDVHMPLSEFSPHDDNNLMAARILPDSPPRTMDLVHEELYPAGFVSGMITPTGIVGFGIETDLDFNALDLDFLGTYNMRVPFEIESPHAQQMLSHTGDLTTGQQTNSGSYPPEPISISNGTLRQESIWRYVPAPGVHAFIDQANLSLPEQEHGIATPESLQDVTKRATTERLTPATRDKILAIVLGQVKPHILPALSAFPSVELLDNLIQYFLAGPVRKASSWVHTPSFRPKEARPELLLIMAAFGAVLTPDRSLRKLGFAIQEVVRNHIPTIYESDNTTVRDLQLQQTFMLQLEIGLWSGNSRKVEIAESFQQPLLTMLRRAGRFKRSSYVTIILNANDDHQVLEQKWRTWVEQESTKRLVYRILGHDTQCSIALSSSPLISYSELGLPLPSSHALWSASSAQEWKKFYLSASGNPLPSLTESIADPELLLSRKHTIDLDLSCLAFLHATWGLVWDYRKLKLLFHGRSNVWDTGVALMSRYQELIKMFEYYRLNFGDQSKAVLELILMHLHMSMEEVQCFSGLEGQDESRRVRTSVEDWAKSKSARQAIWHAGQVVRAARALPPFQVRDFFAIALFQASLALGAYGLANASRTPLNDTLSPPMHMRNPASIVWLDEEETAATYRFISLGVGVPVIHRTGSNEPCVLFDDPKSIMTVLTQTMKNGDGGSTQVNSPFVENLTSIMERLMDSTST